MFNMSASMGPKFAEVADEMTERVRNIGPSPLRGDVPPMEKAEATVGEEDEGETK